VREVVVASRVELHWSDRGEKFLEKFPDFGQHAKSKLQLQ
jgi:hypothetical protein